MKMLVRIVCGLFLLKTLVALPSRYARQLDPDTYDTYDTDLDNVNLEVEDMYDYDLGASIMGPMFEIGTLPPPGVSNQAPAASLDEEEEEEQPLQPLPTTHTSGGSGLDPDTQERPVIPPGSPTCLLCTCLGGSVYCDDVKLESIPPLPKETTHFYARYNMITKINKLDFANMNKLRKIDLTGNQISQIDEDAFYKLPELEELVLNHNKVVQLPALPNTMTLIDASHNRLGSKGIHKEAFKDMHDLIYLYLTDNNIGYIPLPLPESLRSLHLQNNNIQMMLEDTFCNLKDYTYIRKGLEDIRLDGNPINLSRTPQAYACLPRLPIGGLV